jgi:hypothetical protein
MVTDYIDNHSFKMSDLVRNSPSSSECYSKWLVEMCPHTLTSFHISNFYSLTILKLKWT